ncbi:dienelactone hydrolase family protein [Mycolicibacterium sp. BiH015]|uniref:dienelactone hydrolase family protein n=1 Tax=Mycolicibacterium sp. BiH015 TaxID=3018808 RepID=UPI0022E1CD3F|nr:dienelactone hydrolase family protein [Mycolicibacterium sp. BiH015]MDA2890637.1 dienelactone hydrolase family protein [Mycolicibacterium sp. BiH015]
MPDVIISDGARPLRGYSKYPRGDGPWPGVIVIHDVGGLSADIRRAVDRLAAAGFVALAPNLYRPGARVRCVVSMSRAMKTGEGPPIDDLVTARHHLATDPRCTGKIGSVGFCLGGGFCLLLAPSGYFDAAAPNYGNWPPNSDQLATSCPVVASYGGLDKALKGDAERLTAELDKGGVPHDVKEYPNVGHSFMNDWREAPLRLRVFEWTETFKYAEAEAEDAWDRIVAFFTHHLTENSALRE